MNVHELNIKHRLIFSLCNVCTTLTTKKENIKRRVLRVWRFALRYVNPQIQFMWIRNCCEIAKDKRPPCTSFFCVSIVRSSVCLWVLQIKTILSLLSNYLPFVCYRYHHHHHCWWHWIAPAFHLFQSRSRYLSIVVSVVLIWCTRFPIFFAPAYNTPLLNSNCEFFFKIICLSIVQSSRRSNGCLTVVNRGKFATAKEQKEFAANIERND